MLTETKKLFTDDILKEFLARFGTTLADSKKLGGFEAFVYEITKNTQSYILKITHTHRRTAAYLMGELEFVNFLADRGVPTSKAVPFLSGSYVEELDDSKGGTFFAYIFEKSKGRLAKPNDFTEDLISAWGSTAGLMNRLAKEYTPSKKIFQRQQWHEDYIYNFSEHIPLEHADTIRKCYTLIKHIKTYPRTAESYGLIHGDLHQGNFFLCDGGIRPFDFDDCEYSYFVNDIAVPLYYASPSFDEEEEYGQGRSEFAEHFFVTFTRAYLKENYLERFFLENLHDFLLLRSVIMLSLFYPTEFEGEWAEKKAAYLEVFHNRIDKGEPVIDLDFASLASKL